MPAGEAGRGANALGATGPGTEPTRPFATYFMPAPILPRVAQVQAQKQTAAARPRGADPAGLDVHGGHGVGDGSLAIEAEHDEGDVPTPFEYGIYTLPADYTLEDLYNKWLNRGIAIPSLERGYAWTEERASKLIESFAMGLPVPAVFLSSGDDGKSTVIDGTQRLLTVFSYFGGSYPDDSALGGRRFEIVGINRGSRLYGKTFFELDAEDQRGLKDAILRATLVRRSGAGGGDSGMYEIFERLSAGGAQLSAQEVRHRAYAGGLDGLIRRLNRGSDWRSILGSPLPDPRMRDAELVLRCTALFHAADEYAPPMKGFLSSFMARHKSPCDEFLDGERRRFEGACGAALAALGPRPFSNSRGQLRMPLLDSVLVAFARNAGGRGSCQPGDMKARFEALRSDKRFAECAGPSSAAASAVRGRLGLAQEILFE